ncbi:MAG: TIGR04013 family B12-binding domain/radical SAM domain-containing protein [Methanomicrobiales archaeon]|nr:TIGR04013 family B12-binding domain/radical SAM domain-containing protein [Methanomicrobiales archaeon]
MPSSLTVNWRSIGAARNTFAALFAACEREGYRLHPVDRPSADVTCYSLNSINERAYRREIRQAPCITIVGGPHASACYREVAEYADYVVVGEGERALPRLLSWIEAGRQGIPPGVATVDGFHPAEETVILDAYPPFSTVKGYIEITRGCPHHCAYCQTPRLFGRCMRHRSLSCIETAASRYQDIRFVTPNALAYGSDGRRPRLDRVEKLLARLRGNIYFGTFPSEVRPEFVTDEALELISRYCANTKIHFGAQSGSDAILQRLRRGHTTADVIRAVELACEHGFTPVVDFIVGFPFETDADQRETERLILWASRHGLVHIHAFTPLPGTPLAGTAPRSLLRETERTLGRLALQGRLTGSWRRVDDALEPPRDAGRRSRHGSKVRHLPGSSPLER